MSIINVPYLKEIFLGLKIIVPSIGILFLNWSIGTLFLFFWFDLVFIALETVLKILFASQSKFLNRIGIIIRFKFAFIVILFFMLLVTGMSFDGRRSGNLKAEFTAEIIYCLIGLYIIEFLVGYIFNGTYKNMTAKMVESNTYGLMLLIFVLLTGFLLILNFVVPMTSKNYVLGLSIILATNGAEYLFERNRRKKVNFSQSNQ